MIYETLVYLSTYIGLFAVTFYVLTYLDKMHEKIPPFPKKKIPFVSIIVPAWNEEKGIARTMKSILKIKYPQDKFEIIVIDDGSTDQTYNIALKYACKMIKVFKLKKNQGKYAALNYGISKAQGEIIVTTDADSLYVDKSALKKMVPYFDNLKVMCVAPAMAIHKPKGILQRIQQVEYLLGVFLRKVFANLNAIHITPGAFSAYRKKFFKKYGGFKKAYLTEDMEMAIRIQSHGYIIENSLDANVYTVAPKKFKELLKQRRRWYTGLLKNLWDYKRLFSLKYGSLGTIVLPIALITIILSVTLIITMIINILFDLHKEVLLWKSVNFNILQNFEFNKFILERYAFSIISNPLFTFFLLFAGVLLGYMIFAKRKIKENTDIKISMILFSIFYSFLFAFWWIISFFYTLFNKKVSWR